MKILVIDDEPLIHISIEKLIQACSKEDEVLHAYNGHEMLKMLEEHEIAMAYVDIKMPGPSGLEAIKLGKEISPDTRYYIMTGFNEFEYAKQAVKLKVEDYLMKPLDKKTIQETITAVRLQQYLAGERRKNLFRTWLESALNGRNIGLGEYKGYFCGLLMITVDGENLVSDPILILDDPFSALDKTTEVEVFEHLRQMVPDSIIFLISHRLYLFSETDGVIWMDNGTAEFSCHL